MVAHTTKQEDYSKDKWPGPTASNTRPMTNDGDSGFRVLLELLLLALAQSVTNA